MCRNNWKNKRFRNNNGQVTVEPVSTLQENGNSFCNGQYWTGRVRIVMS